MASHAFIVQRQGQLLAAVDGLTTKGLKACE
jgi:hypothetical protein